MPREAPKAVVWEHEQVSGREEIGAVLEYHGLMRAEQLSREVSCVAIVRARQRDREAILMSASASYQDACGSTAGRRGNYGPDDRLGSVARHAAHFSMGEAVRHVSGQPTKALTDRKSYQTYLSVMADAIWHEGFRERLDHGHHNTILLPAFFNTSTDQLQESVIRDVFGSHFDAVPYVEGYQQVLVEIPEVSGEITGHLQQVAITRLKSQLARLRDAGDPGRAQCIQHYIRGWQNGSRRFSGASMVKEILQFSDSAKIDAGVEEDSGTGLLCWGGASTEAGDDRTDRAHATGSEVS